MQTMQSFRNPEELHQPAQEGRQLSVCSMPFFHRIWQGAKMGGPCIFFRLFLFQAEFFFIFFLSFRTEAEPCRATLSLKIPTVSNTTVRKVFMGLCKRFLNSFRLSVSITGHVFRLATDQNKVSFASVIQMNMAIIAAIGPTGETSQSKIKGDKRQENQL